MRHAILLTAGLLNLALSPLANAQCVDQVTHLTGTQTIAGTDVTVTSSGVVSGLSTYCTETLPYFIGYNSGSGTGSYTFVFDPPILSARFNVSGISNIPPDGEEVWVYVNGAHYAIPAAGDPQVCDPLA